jgi:hypothetical protein
MLRFQGPRARRGLFAVVLLLLALAGCQTLDQQQRRWIFQPNDRAWGSRPAAEGMQDVWIDFNSRATGQPVRLHALWHAGRATPDAATCAPVLLYLHGARWDVRGSAWRIRRMQALGFSVLAIDYRGFGRSTPQLPSEAMALRRRARRLGLAGLASTRTRRASSLAIRWAAAWRCSWPSRCTTQRGLMVEGTSPRSPTWRAP